MSREDIPLDFEQQAAYDAAYKALQQPDRGPFCAPIPTLVSMEASVAGDNEMNEFPVTIITPTKGHHALSRAVEGLDGLEKEEASLKERSSLAQQLTQIITNQPYTNSEHAIASLHQAGQVVPRRVCQHPFRKNDIVWVCRTCQADETCVLCHNCFSQSDHEGHDVAFYHAQAGGCCDCGDPDAWDPAGFCPHHGPNVQCTPVEVNAALPTGMVHRVRGVVPAAIDWMVQVIARNAEAGHDRVHARPNKSAASSATKMQEDSESAVDRMDVDVEDDSENTDDSDEERSESMAPLGLAQQSYAGTHSNPLGRPHVFSPEAASSSAAKKPDAIARFHEQRAAMLGATGSAGHGWYLVLHADDIHSSTQIADAIREFLGTSNYYTDSLLQKVIRALRLYGQLVIWGNLETVSQIGATQFHLWMDRDGVACGRVGAMMVERFNRLTKHRLFCGLVTRDELMMEQRAVALLQWLSEVARSCDPLCQAVAECILPNRHLVPLLRADFKMSARVTKAWYSLLLTLLAVPTFKSHLAAAYCDTYRYVTSKYARGMGVLERSGYTLSVQFLNRVTYVVDLVKGRDLLGKLGKSLLETMLVACRSKHLNGRLDPNHFVLTHRRYSPCISDLKCVLNVKGMPRLFACKGGSFLWDWIDTLSISQQMDPQHWRTWKQGHVEDESRGWVGAFNASISLGSLFERLLGWDDNEQSPISDPASPLSKELMSCSELSYHILLDGVFAWQKKEMHLYQATPLQSTEQHKFAPGSLPFSTVSASNGTAVAMHHLPVAQNTSFSFHLPLHRFIAGCLRELCLRRDDALSGISSLLQRLSIGLGDKDCDHLFLGLMEFPLLIVSRAAQVRAGLWRRNGAGLSDQVLNYSEPPFCRTMRDADLLLVQFSVLGRTLNQSPNSTPQATDVGMAFFVNLLLHRLGVFEFCGLRRAPDEFISRYVEETEKGLYTAEPKAKDSSSSDLVLPSSYSPANDQASFLVLLEEFLYCIIIFTSELPQVAPSDRNKHTEQARQRLHREVVHRLASGPKTHSELLEVHHVMSHWDNLLLSEEGKLINPDDATGAALGKVLEEVADRKSSSKLEADKWGIKRDAWKIYDPSFHHISLRMHQTAAENRPKPVVDKASPWGQTAQPYVPEPPEAHPIFDRLRRDATSDAATLAVAYRVLHMHMREKTDRDTSHLPGRLAYDKDKSETALARAVHLLTLGVYAWTKSSRSDDYWRGHGGGSPGSIFYDWGGNVAPVLSDWVEAVLLADPAIVTGTEWYRGEENLLTLLRRLAIAGGEAGSFTAQDVCVSGGAAWICETAAKHSFAAKDLVRPRLKDANASSKKMSLAERQRRSREKAMAMMRAAQSNFAGMNAAELGEKEDEAVEDSSNTQSPETSSSPHRPVRATSFGSTYSTTSSIQTSGSEAGGLPSTVMMESEPEVAAVPPRLLKERPRCIICSEFEVMDTASVQKEHAEDGEGMRKRSKKRAENALGFVGYIQPSTVLKGGGGPPPDLGSPLSPVREFVGNHVALCGHAVHSECCESYLATVSQREDRVIGKRDEFKCPLCQRLSNCLVPFIDVGSDWVQPPTNSLYCLPTSDSETEQEKMVVDPPASAPPPDLGQFLSSTPWWVSRTSSNVIWDGQSGFLQQSSGLSPESTPESSPHKSGRRRVRRPLTKKDLYAAWNAMMRTPRFVRKRLRSRASQTDGGSGYGRDDHPHNSEPEESSGETVVWRRFMDQVSDLSYRADSKRLGDEHLHDLFGEFRHYVVEKYAYNMANRFAGGEPTEWPFCVFNEPLSDQRRQEMSREKILSKLLLAIQAFTYSCCCEAFEAKRAYRKSMESGRSKSDSALDSVLSKFGIAGVTCGGELVVMPNPVLEKDNGLQPFEGRIGKLRYLGLALLAASGAVAADVVQLALSFPTEKATAEGKNTDREKKPDRAPIAYPILLGNVLTHVIAAMCATCGRGRALSDSLDLAWSPPFSSMGSFVSSDDLTTGMSVDSVVEDCEGFIKLGILARMLQVLLGGLRAPSAGFPYPSSVLMLLQEYIRKCSESDNNAESSWKTSCARLLMAALSGQEDTDATRAMEVFLPTSDHVDDACESALSAACSFLIDAGTILQILLPSVVLRYNATLEIPGPQSTTTSSVDLFDKLRSNFMIEPLSDMVSSPLTLEIVSNWYRTAEQQGKMALEQGDSFPSTKSTLRGRLYRTQGFREFDWPSAGFVAKSENGQKNKGPLRVGTEEQPEDGPSAMQIERLAPTSGSLVTSDVISRRTPLVAYSSRKIIPLLGGYSTGSARASTRPRVAGMPVAYTDLYAELGTLMPECEQTAVCLVCGEVLNAGGKGECTRHSYKCGAGAGIFFLLQECSALILHRSKAAYIHSPYVDSHGETPQHRGRPLNLDLDRYEHLREVWFGHGVRQHVLAERGSSRQVILPDFY